MVNTQWRWLSTTTWTSTVHTMRTIFLRSAWNATSFSWSTMMATPPATTTWKASSAGNATAQWVRMGPLSSQRSSSCSHPSPWALSFAQAMNTTTSVSSLLLLTLRLQLRIPHLCFLVTRCQYGPRVQSFTELMVLGLQELGCRG